MARIELVHLLTFVTVADLSSITRAADRLACVQSNVTARVGQLEALLNERLFIRSRRGVAMTEAGLRLYPKARDILDRVRALQELTAPDGVCGVLRLGVVETVATLDLPGILAEIRDRQPALSVEFSTGSTQELLRAVKDLKLDIAIVSGAAADGALVGQTICYDELVLVHAAAGPDLSVAPNSATPPLYVYKAGCAFRAALEAWLASLNAVPSAINEMGALDGILAHVAAGNGCTALPKRIVAQHVLGNALRMQPIPGNFGRAQTTIVYLRDAAGSAKLAAFNEVAARSIRAKQALHFPASLS
ncbi:MAG: LysR family transcriptional regulator [Rhodomicrobium sp.]